MGSLRTILPEAHFIVCVRTPEHALSSQISAVAAAKPLFGVATGSPAWQRLFLDLYAQTLDHLAALLGSWRYGTVAIVDTAALRRRPGPTIRAVMARLAIPETPSVTRAIDGLGRSGASSHRHSVADMALDREVLHRRLEPGYRRLISLSHCVGTST